MELLESFLQVPHQKVTSVSGKVGDFAFRVADFTHLPTHCKFVALMPQWDLLDFIAGHAKKFPSFHLWLEHEAVGLMEEAGRITGVEARTPGGEVRIASDLVVGCDGRHSITRQAGHLDVQEFGVPIDVLWFRISRVGKRSPSNCWET